MKYLKLKLKTQFFALLLLMVQVSAYAQTTPNSAAPTDASVDTSVAIKAAAVSQVSKEQLKLYAEEIESLSNLQPMNLNAEDFLIEGDQEALNASALALKERILEASHQIAKMYIIASKVKPLVKMVSPEDLKDDDSTVLAIYQTNTAEFQAAFDRMILVLTSLQIPNSKYDFQSAVKLCQSTVCSTAVLMAFKTLQQVGVSLNQDLDISKLASWSLNIPYQNNFIARSINDAMNDLSKPNQANSFYATILKASFSPFLSMVTYGQSFGVRFIEIFTKLTAANIRLMATRTASASWLVNLQQEFNVLQNKELSRTAQIENMEWLLDESGNSSASESNATSTDSNQYKSFYQSTQGQWFAIKIKLRKYVLKINPPQYKVDNKTIAKNTYIDSQTVSIRPARKMNTEFMVMNMVNQQSNHFSCVFRSAEFDLTVVDQGNFFTITLKQHGRVLVSDQFIGRQNLIQKP